jgi:mRNA interferase MazF
VVDKWGIYFCDLDPTHGSEQRGKRPVLVVSCDAVNHSLPVSSVLPLSSIKPGDSFYPSEVLLPARLTGLPKDSVAMVQQIRTLDHTRLGARAGVLMDPDKREQVKDALRAYFEV